MLIAVWYGAAAGVGIALLVSGIYLVHILMDLAEYTLLDPLTHLLLFNLMALLVGRLPSHARRNLVHFKKASSDLAKANEELRNTSQTLKQTERLAAQGQLSAGIAHEIRNPLGSIKGAVEILTSDVPSSHPKQEFVKIVRQEVARINHLVEEFLCFARPPGPKVRSVELSDLVGSAVRLVEGHAAGQGIDIVCDCSKRTIAVDADQMRQVLLNLFLNSIEAMPRGGTLRVTSDKDGEEGAAIVVFDTGGNADSVNLDNIFNPFYTTKPHGTGLGLLISHQLVRNHGGRLTAEHNAEGGLTFTVLLPDVPGEMELSRTG